MQVLFFRLKSNNFVPRSPQTRNYEEMMTKWCDYHYRNLNNKIITRLFPHLIETKQGGNCMRLSPIPATRQGAERPPWGTHAFDFLHLCNFRAQSNHNQPSALGHPTGLSHITILRSQICSLWLYKFINNHHYTRHLRLHKQPLFLDEDNPHPPNRQMAKRKQVPLHLMPYSVLICGTVSLLPTPAQVSQMRGTQRKSLGKSRTRNLIKETSIMQKTAGTYTSK